VKARRAAAEVAFVALLSVLSALVVRDHQLGDSPTFDETYHLLAGAEYVLDGTFTANLEHPPLMKDLAGLALAGSPVVPPGRFAPRDPSPTGRFLPFLYGNSLPADRMVALGRRPFPWLLALLVAVTYATARGLYGPGAAVLSATLVALEPVLVAHAGVIHTDVGAALTMTSAVALGTLASGRRHAGWWALSGLALGAALATKFSAVLLLPCFVLLPFLGKGGAGGGGGVPPLSRIGRGLGGAALAAATAFGVLLAVYSWNLRNMSPEGARSAVRTFLEARQVPDGTAGPLLRLSSLSPPLGHYTAGLASVTRLSVAGRGANYFHGRVSDATTPAYFPVAFAVKSTPSFLALTLLLFLLGGAGLFSRRSLSLLVPAGVLLAAAVTSSFNIGIRHILPVYPLLAIAGAGALAARLSPRAFAGAALVLGLGSAASLRSSHPFEMGYFNFLVGGAEGGSRWLSDSNLDWGQDMKRLGDFLREKGWDRDTTVVAYGGLATNYYMRDVLLLDPAAPIAPGRYAVGATIEAIGGPFVSNIEGPAAGAQVEELVRLLRDRGRRVARVGSITVWELPPAQLAPPPPAPRAGPG
jgi:hypothetical protein